MTKGAGSRAASLAMAFKRLEAAQDHRRRINAPQLVPLVRAGARLIVGHLLERSAPLLQEEPAIAEESAAA